jgi:HAT1-interacting factor 1
MINSVCATEKFDQAIIDYEAGLFLKHDVLPNSSRQIAEAHYKLSMVLDLTSGRLSDAIMHAEKALQSVEARSSELKDGLSGQLKPESRGQAVGDAKRNAKGKGKAVGGRLIREDLVQDMTKVQIEGELKELDGLKEDLALKASLIWFMVLQLYS